jgi:hypothetical protein
MVMVDKIIVDKVIVKSVPAYGPIHHYALPHCGGEVVGRVVFVIPKKP